MPNEPLPPDANFDGAQIAEPDTGTWVTTSGPNIEQTYSVNELGDLQRLRRAMRQPLQGISLGQADVHGFAELSEEIEPDEAPPSRHIIESQDHERRLRDSVHIVMNANAVRIEDQPSVVGHRESQYLDVIREQKYSSMLAYEVVSSERPMLVSHVKGRTLEEIVQMKVCQDVYGSVDGQRVEFRCAKCGLDTPSSFAFFCDGRLYCSEHVPNLEMCAACGELVEGCAPVHTYDGREVMGCARCVTRTAAGCRNCGAPITVEHFETRRCGTCIEQIGEGDPYREFSKGLRWVNTVKGSTVKSRRIFSCEIEALMKHTRQGIRGLSRAIPKECGLTTDSSVSASGDEDYSLEGFEIQTPRLAGKKGEECVQRITSALRGVEAEVNKTCGMHIHLDGKGIMTQSRKEFPTALLQLWKSHLIFEDVILSLLPFKRRRNDFCRPMGEAFKLQEIETCESVFDAEKLWYKTRTYTETRSEKEHHYHSSRYFGVNFHSLLGHGHLEIRYHPGTCNARKILEWANLHALIMDTCAGKKMTYDFLREAQATSSLREKTNMLFEKIGLAESSRQYFYSRQKKFANKKNDETNS